VATVTREYY